MKNTQKYIDYSVNQILSLCKIPSPTGFTKKITAYLIKEFENMNNKAVSTIKGSVLVELGGRGSPLLLAAHVDTLGAMVRTVKSDGRLRITKIGGYPENNIEGENVIIHTRDNQEYTGTVQMINASTHANRELNDTKRNDSTIEVIIDEKVAKPQDVKKLGIRNGDFISFDPRTILTESGFIKSRHLDDKASAGILIGLAKYIKENKITPSRKVYLLFTTYEEVGHGGSAGIPEDVEEMVAVDMGVIGTDLECNEQQVSICAKDSGGPYDYDTVTRLIKTAETEKLNHAVDIYPFYGSDVWTALSSGKDIKFGLIGPGIYASHGYERGHKEGIENTFKLLAKYIT
ncbi:MAG: M42 family metallopeptidase [Spirochaetes bacterium]|nr:M42 family metallopeptidase [Spirochaetota bacterium]